MPNGRNGKVKRIKLVVNYFTSECLFKNRENVADEFAEHFVEVAVER